MSESQPVRITGGTFFIGLMLFCIACNTCRIDQRLRVIRDKLPPAVVEVGK